MHVVRELHFSIDVAKNQLPQIRSIAMLEVIRNRARIAALLLLGLASAGWRADAAGAAEGPSCLWLVSTRGSGCGAQPNLRFWRYADSPGWLEATLEEFLAADQPGVPTAIWIHGNRISFCESQTNGLSAYRSFCCQSAGRAFRFVVWSWPAEQISGQLEDLKLKANRSDCEGYNLAWLVNRMHPQVPVSLLGYSYGARLASGALHILGGGQVNGRRLDSIQPGRVPMRSVMMAAALDNHWVAPGHRFGQAFNPLDQMLVFVNPADKVLSKYHLLYGWKKGPQALGSTGVAGGLGEHCPKLSQINVSGSVGSTHDWRLYMESPHLVMRMRPYALFETATR